MTEQEVNILIAQAQAHDENAMEELLRQFKSKVTAISREYFLLGADGDDLSQEGMIGLFKAIMIYDQTKNHNFGAFASLCIHRHLQNAVKLATRKKNGPLNNYLPISHFDGSSFTDDDEKLKLVLADDKSNVEENFLLQEKNSNLTKSLHQLCEGEQLEILLLYLDGLSYLDIANKLKISTKKVDNTIQAIKRKIKVQNLKND